MNMRQRRLNGWRRLALMPVLLLAVLMLVLAASLAFRGTAHAQSGSTGAVTIASPAHLIARTTLQVSGTVTCTLPAGATFVNAFVIVYVTQASARVIVQGSGGMFLTTTCNGTAPTFQVFATPPAGSAPFHGGSAIAFGILTFDWIDALGNFHEDSFSSNPETIRLTG